METKSYKEGGMGGKKQKEFWVKVNEKEEMEVNLNSKYTIEKENKYYDVMPFVIDLINEKNQL